MSDAMTMERLEEIRRALKGTPWRRDLLGTAEELLAEVDRLRAEEPAETMDLRSQLINQDDLVAEVFRLQAALLAARTEADELRQQGEPVVPASPEAFEASFGSLKDVFGSPEAQEYFASLRGAADDSDRAGPPLVWTSNGEAGDGQNECSVCGQELDEPHSWRDCLKCVERAAGFTEHAAAEEIDRLSAENLQLRNKLLDQDALIAEIDRLQAESLSVRTDLYKLRASLTSKDE